MLCRILCAALLVPLVACDGDEDGDPGDGGNGGNGGDERTVTLVATEYAFSPSSITAEPGERLRIVLDNQGTMEHSLAVELPGGDVELPTPVAAGETAALRLTVPETAGDIAFYCPLLDHRSLGMEGTLRVRAGDETPGLVIEEEVGGFTSPVAMVALPGEAGGYFIVDQVGLVWHLDEAGTRGASPFLDLRDRMVELDPVYDERGLLGMALAPDFASSGLFYVYFSAPRRAEAPVDFDHTSELAELRVSESDPTMADLDTYRMIMQIDQPQANHNGGTILFGPDELLYISVGDGGNANDVGVGHADEGNGQNLETLLGKILRIDVRRGEPYSVPDDNPFVDGDGLDEIWAYGFRNPYRFSFWAEDDAEVDVRLLVADAGQNLWEEVSVVTAGGNYGWPIKEATHCFDQTKPDEELASCANEGAMGEPLIDPVIEYQNANVEGGLGHAVIGGFIYRGADIPELAGQYVFGDFSSSLEAPQGKLFVARPRDSGLWTLEQPVIGDGAEHLGVFVLGFGEDRNGELYVLSRDVLGPTGSSGSVSAIGAAPMEAPEGPGTPGDGPTGDDTSGDDTAGGDTGGDDTGDDDSGGLPPY